MQENAELLPAKELKVPAAQPVHAVAPEHTSVYEPGAHATHVVDIDAPVELE